MKKKILSFVLVFTCLLGGSMTAFASEKEPEARYDPGLTGYEYSAYSIQSRVREQTWSHTSYPGDIQVSYSVSRTQHTNVSTSVKSEFDMMVAKVGVSAEVAMGVSRTVSESVTYRKASPNDTARFMYGSHVAKTTGVVKRWVQGKVVSTKSVDGQWTHESYSAIDKIG